MPRTYVALDLELTGLDPQRDAITEIGMVKFKGDEVLDTFSSLVNPHRPIPFKIEQLVGISESDVADAPSIGSLKGEILSFARNYPVVGHSVETDLEFINRHGLFLDNLGIDTFELATILLPEVNRYSLGNLSDFLDIELSRQHRAMADAMATKDLFLALIEEMSQWDTATLREITRLSRNSDWSLLRVFNDVLAERRERERARTPVRGHPAAPANLSLQPSEAQEMPHLEPTSTITPIDEEALVEFMSPEGEFARSFPDYEHRTEQIEMLRGVTQAFNTPNHLLVEAGAGTGKSIAYLLPAIHFAVQNGRRVVISSNTINLQDQLFNKDIPDLQEILPTSFRAAVLKGRGNYICLRRLNTFRRSRQLSVDETRVLAKVLAWLPKTETGDRAELLLINEEWKVWQDIQASSEMCLRDRCPFQHSGQCFFYRAREKAQRAHLVIVNHALLLTDLALESRILPEYDHVIVDEAHHLEERATSQFSFHAGHRDVRNFLSGISYETNEAPGGALADVPVLFGDTSVEDPKRETITSLIETLRSRVREAKRALHALFDTVAEFLENHTDGSGSGRYDQRERITSGFRFQPGWTKIEIAWENFASPFMEILNGLEQLVEHIEGSGLGEEEERDEVLQSLRAYLQRGTEIWEGLYQILMEPEDNGIYWVSRSRYDDEIVVHSAPLHVGVLLRDRLFTEKDCVILTSATLRTARSFDFIEDRLGLEDPVKLALESPFDFEKSLLLYVPTDIPEPNQPYYQKHVEKALINLCRATEGRTLVLFTSSSHLRRTYKAIRGPLEEDEIVLFGQYIDGSRRQLLSRFRNTPKSVLMGTRSFWEGIDVVGQALSCLVIARLPFSVPTDPILAARAETFDNPFNEYYLPEAILSFRQGFGRLIRSRDDYGIVVVLDKRILTKSYSSMFLSSLPSCTARQGPLSSLPKLARRWLDPRLRE